MDCLLNVLVGLSNRFCEALLWLVEIPSNQKSLKWKTQSKRWSIRNSGIDLSRYRFWNSNGSNRKNDFGYNDLCYLWVLLKIRFREIKICVKLTCEKIRHFSSSDIGLKIRSVHSLNVAHDLVSVKSQSKLFISNRCISCFHRWYMHFAILQAFHLRIHFKTLSYEFVFRKHYMRIL